MDFIHHWIWSSSGPAEVTKWSWLVLAVYWIVTWMSVKKTARAESVSGRWTHLAFLAMGTLLFAWNSMPVAFLQLRLYPDALWIRWTGAALTVAGAAFAIWARIILGRNWSAQVQIKQGHQLIRSGPYRFVRHPIYTGLLLALFGNALAIGAVRAYLAFVLIAIGFARKAKKEESFLAGEFGPAFDEHRRSTGFFLPRFS